MEKHEILEDEALFDLKNGKYNKAASALYFSLRYLSEKILKLFGEQIPRRDDKLSNAILNKGFKEASIILRILYRTRIKADYSDISVSKEEVLTNLKLFQKAKKELLDYINEKV